MSIVEILYFVAGLVLLVIGAEALVRGASRLAAAVGVSSLVIGLTVVAYGTSSPELAVSVQSGFAGQADIALGNVVGSNIFNVLFILGISALIIPLIVDRQLVRFDVPVMVVVSLLVYFFALDGNLVFWEGLILFAGVVGYTIFLIQLSRRANAALKAEFEQEFSEAPPRTARDWLVSIGLVIVGLVMLVVGSRWLVDGAIAIAELFGVSELVIGLTIVAAGTSLPEVATSIVAAIRGERDIAVGNVVGSNVFNILSVLGMTAMVAPGGVPISPAALAFDMPVMIIVAIACVVVFFTGLVISRWEGLLFLAYYVAYTAYLVIKESPDGNTSFLTNSILYGLVPITLLALIISVVYDIRTRRASATSS
jgi:cation:H+ antiporter